MNRDVRSGLALVCFAALLAVVWVGTHAAIIGFFTFIVAVAGLGRTTLGLLRD